MQEDDKLYYFPVPEITLKDLLDWQDPDERSQCHLVRLNAKNDLKSTTHGNIKMYQKCFGNTVIINDKEIALFRIGKEVFAIQAKCPHLGGPLHLADIEELSTGKMAVKCPWHKWTFDIASGICVTPKDRNLIAKTFPVRVDNLGQIRVGFDSFGPSAFAEMDF
ncbi:unnamed protein product [Candidula unifasciata]|uniref:Rieske domain-containing protein n=1 Tax=Candidula unifasciata TaxID=100452 RepID=A0A8S3Z1R7_9EUPU|nr:unnamed protein product [Candidula unifasciata]